VLVVPTALLIGDPVVSHLMELVNWQMTFITLAFFVATGVIGMLIFAKPQEDTQEC
jgi:predicted MFS family arabinose efflux permease